ncbi:MAG: large conductance mechanosensitive channel protein MscL [Fimbriimonadaceae bacterium]|nr:large conductance mechanosensitive channel protein MscL [Fimbriimonadaceae bacterium]
MLKEFKEFAAQGSMLDLAIGVVIGAAFGKIIDSLVNHLLNPLIGMFGSTDFSLAFLVLKGDAGGATTIDAAQKNGAIVLGYGAFLSAVLNFVIVAFALFMVVKGVNKMRKQQAEATAAPEAPPADVTLLTEIRDLLRSRGA